MAEQSNRYRELSDFFVKTQDLVEDIVRENAQLRACLRAFESLGGSPQEADIQARLRLSEEERMALDREFGEAKDELVEMRTQLSESAQRFADLSEQVNLLTNLHVAASQLHASLDHAEVLRSIQEIATNLVGAEAFHVFIVDEKTGRAELVLSEGQKTDVSGVGRGEGVIGACLESGLPHFAADTRVAEAAPFEAPLAVIPFDLSGVVVGLLSIHKLFQQKTAFSELDFELFRLLGAQAATAVYASRLHMTSERKLATLRGFIDMLKGPAGA
ncbi:MAG: GAF domain-containing protein [Vicinamibacteria bacterium]|nr:GAF domain-containing protein [Vicinamibacteria bacterium]